MNNKAIQYGIIGGIFSIIFTVIIYLMNDAIIKKWFYPLIFMSILFIVNIVLLSLSATKTRADQGGFISFKNAFSASFTTAVIISLISFVVGLLLYYVIDPQYGENMKNATINMMEENADKWGLSEDMLDKQIAQIEKQNNYSFVGLLRQTLLGLLFYGFICLIIAAVVKKKNPDVIIE